MNKYYRLSLVLLSWLCVGVLAACKALPRPVVTSKELNLYAFSEYVPAELIAGFEKEFGVKVNYVTYATNEEMLASLLAKPTAYDLIVPSDYMVEILNGQKALLPLNVSAIPNYQNLDPAFLHPYFDPGSSTSGAAVADQKDKFSVPYLWGTTGILYDQARISTPITSWKDLWQPKFAGHIVVLDDAREMLGIALLTLGYDKNETNPARLQEARDKLKELAPGIVAYDAETPEKYLLSGEAWIAVVYNGDAALAERSNPNLKYVLPSEGVGFWIDNMAIPVAAPHADASTAFINFVLEAKNGALLVRDYPYSTPNSGALDYLKSNDPKLYKTYTTSLASNPSEKDLLHAKLVKNVDAISAGLYEKYWVDVKSVK